MGYRPLYQTDPISIHTSAREVTPSCWSIKEPKIISIHTSAREVTHGGCLGYFRIRYFNPHFREGSDIRDTVNYLA